MKKILVIGCSVTGGMPKNEWYSWSQHLGELADCQIINMALGGASMQLLSYLLKKGKEIYNPDFIIVQKTFPYRVNYIDNTFDINNYIIKKSQKYHCLDQKLISSGKILTITPSNASTMIATLQKKVKFARSYYKNFHQEVSESDYNVHSDWLDYNSNFSFDTKYFGDLSHNLETKLDQNGHLNTIGSKLLAERVYDDIKRNLH